MMLSPAVNGTCDSAFLPVKEAFLENFRRRKEAGASVCVVLEGKKVVDLWAGTCDRHGKKPWLENTLATIFSCTKGITAICALRLVDQGKLDLDKPVCHYWPGFASQGKESITVGMLLNHTAALPAIAKPLGNRSIFQWDTMVSALENQKPWWSPGYMHGYHVVTFGWLVGEVIRRITGLSLQDYLKRDITGPLGIDVSIGLGKSGLGREAYMLRKRPATLHKDLFRLWWAILRKPTGPTAKAFTNPLSIINGMNSNSWKMAQIPGANGYANARALASLYGKIVQGENGGNNSAIFSRDMLAMCSRETSQGHDAVLNLSTRFGPGFMLSQPGKSGEFGPNPRSFGHPGAGGAIGFADPDAHMGFGYVMNKMNSYILVDPRPKRIINAVYGCLSS